MPELVISDNVRNKQTVSVTNAQSTNNSGSTDRGVNNRNMVSQLTLEGGVEVLGTTECSEAVSVGEFSEYAGLAGVLKLNSIGH